MTFRKRWWRLKFLVRESLTRFCHFCGKGENDVQYLLAGPKVFICDSCVLLSCDLLATHLDKCVNQFIEGKNKVESALSKIEDGSDNG